MFWFWLLCAIGLVAWCWGVGYSILLLMDTIRIYREGKKDGLIGGKKHG
jgi:hypothetical protein